MKNKKIKRILKIIFVLMIIFISTAQYAYAWTPDYNKVESYTAGNTGNVIYKTMGTVINIVSIAGAGIAIIMLIVLGVRYMNTTHPADKAEVKKQIPAYVTGAVILFSASAILKILQKFIEGNINTI